MKKYKLIKEYPGSPKLGTIVMNGIIGVNKNNPNLSFDGSRRLRDIELPHKYPEFWEEVVDKNPLKLEVGKEYILQYIHCKSKPQHIKITGFTGDGYPWQERVSDGGLKGIVTPGCYRLIEEVVEKDYEILSFKEKSGQISVLQSNGKYYDKDGTKFDPNGYFCGYTIEQELNDNAVIHSVKRLSDEEVFTVGDKIKFQGNGCSDITTILKFELVNNKVHAQSGSVSFHINFIHHIKKPLFTTEDGIDIYGGDKFWAANINRFIVKEKFACVNCTIKLWESKKWIIYSTKEAAEEYILMNKPCLSINDVQNTLANHSTNLKNRLKDLVKSKFRFLKVNS